MKDKILLLMWLFGTPMLLGLSVFVGEVFVVVGLLYGIGGFIWVPTFMKDTKNNNKETL